jgi:hypothetical protein
MRKSCTSILALAAGLAVLPTFSHATTVTYVQSSQGCTTSCGIDTNNTVQVSNTVSPTNSTPLAAGVFDVLVTLDTGWTFMNDPSGSGHQASFGFASTLSGLSFSNITTDFTANVQNLALKSSNPGAVSFAINPYKWDQDGGFGDGLSTNTGSGPSTLSVLDFRVTTGTTDTLTQFLATLLASIDGSNSIFAADVSSSNGNTGGIGFRLLPGGTQGQTPLPAALPLFASGTGLFGFLTWRRKRKARALA